MTKEIESKIRIKLIALMEKAMDDDEIVDALDMWWCDSCFERMAEAALNTLSTMHDFDHWCKDNEYMKE